MSLREEIAELEIYCARMTAKADVAERAGSRWGAAYFDSLCENAEKRLRSLRAELDDEESRGGFDRIARRLNLSEF